MEGLIKEIPILSRAWSPSKAITVRASDKVKISIAIVKKRLKKKYNIIPLERLSTEYTIVNYLSAINCMGVLSVVATSMNTLVKIKFRIEKKGQCSKIRNGHTANITLGNLGVYSLRCGYDLTGTVITSNKPVAVFVGSECPRRHRVDITEMMMVPNNILGFSYVLTSRKDMASLYRVVCPMGYTRIESSDGKEWTCRPRKAVDIKLPPGGPVCLLAHKPIRVLAGFQPQIPHRRRRPKRIGTHVILQELPSTGQFLQKYHVYDNRITGPNPWSARGAKMYTVTLVVQKDVVDSLIKALARYVERKGKIEKRNMASCEFVTLSFSLFMKQKVLMSPVPFWFSMFKFGPGIDYGIFPRTLLDVTNCPSEKGYLYFPSDDWCLKYYNTQLTRRLSNKQCRNDEGHLVDIPDDHKNKLIATVFGKSKANSMYIAALRRRRLGNKVWMWSNCSIVSNYNKKQNKARCLTLHGKNLKWKQTLCGTNHSSLCEVDVLHGQYKPGQTKRKHYNCREKRKRFPLHHTPQGMNRVTHHSNSRFHEAETSFGKSTKAPTTKGYDISLSTKTEKSYNGSTKSTSLKTDLVQQTPTLSTTSIQTTPTEPVDDYDDYNYDDIDDTAETTESRSGPETKTKTAKIQNISRQQNSKSMTSETTQVTPSKTTTSTNTGILHEPVQRTLNMTLVLEHYKQKYPGWKNQFVAREQLLSRAARVRHRCHCFCRSNQLHNTSQEAIKEHKKKIQKQLGVKTSSLKKGLARKISAADRRPSAAVVGCIGFLFLLLPFALIVLSDVSAFMAQHRRRTKRRENQDTYLNSSLNSLPKSP